MNDDRKRFGLTMRTVNATGYHEPRDALAHDWGIFMKSLFPDDLWMPLPNMGNGIVPFLKKWELNAIIITGGNDIGTTPSRDSTEKTILDHAMARDIPVLGICRGIQFFQHYFKGKLTRCNPNIHVNNRHQVHVLKDLPVSIPCQATPCVNSFHDWGIRKDQLVDELTPFAVSEDGFIEGLFSMSRPLLGLQWHPERDEDINEFDKFLIKEFFKKWT